MTNYLNYILFGILLFFPFMLFAYYPLRYFKRFNTKITFLLEISLSIPEVVLFFFTFKYFSDYYILCVFEILLFNVLAYILLYKINLGRIFFNLLLIVNVANFTVIFAKYLAIVLFHQTTDLNFHWTNCVCIVITELIFVLPIFFYVKHYSDSMIRNSDYDYIWQIAWIIPFLLSVLGFILVYTSSIDAKTISGLYAKKSFLCAIIVVSLLLNYSFIAKLIGTQHNVLILKNDLHYQSIQKMQLQKIEDQIHNTRVLRHDLRHHIRLLSTYLEQEDYVSLKNYVQEYSESVQQISQLHYTNNTLINALLVYYADLCHSDQITFDVKIALPDTLDFKDNEITILFSNLLENAYHACCEMNKQHTPYIKVHSTYKSNNLFILVDNSFHHTTKQDSCGNFLTTKPDGNGLGLQSVKEIVSKHDGHIKIDTSKNVFKVSICIPNPC